MPIGIAVNRAIAEAVADTHQASLAVAGNCLEDRVDLVAESLVVEDTEQDTLEQVVADILVEEDTSGGLVEEDSSAAELGSPAELDSSAVVGSSAEADSLVVREPASLEPADSSADHLAAGMLEVAAAGTPAGNLDSQPDKADQEEVVDSLEEGHTW